MKDYYEHIDDYVNGLLSDELRVMFEAELGRNASLKKAVDNYVIAKDLSAGLLEVDMMETMERLKKTSASEVVSEGKEEQGRVIDLDSKKERKGYFRREWLAAALVVGLLAVTGWWMMQAGGDGLDRDYIMANWVEPYNEDATKSLEDEVLEDPFEEGKRQYGLYDFEKSIPLFETYLSEVSEKKLRSEGYFWLGAAYLQVWDVEKAREAWEKSDEEGAKENLRLIENSAKRK